MIKTIEKMLRKPESYDEKIWQKTIVNFILLLMPRYILCLENLSIKDFYTSKKPKDRESDFMLIDENGYVDLIEIKKPF